MTYTKLTFNIISAPKPYLFIGSKMRGMLGYALKEEVCINPTMKCEGCFAASECVFYEMYEKTNATQHYRLDFKLESKKYKFSLLLFGNLQTESETIEKAMLKALGDYEKIESKIKHKNLNTDANHASVLKISFVTPLRIKKQNRYARDTIDLLDILRSIYRRDRDLRGETMKPLKIEEEYKVVTKHLYYKELTRRSNKQQTKMSMGGLMGEIVISDVDKEICSLLKLGEVIGVGKATVFGLGKIKVENIA